MINTKASRLAQKGLVAWCEARGMKVNSARRQRDGSVRVYLYQPFGQERATEARWGGKQQAWSLSLYRQDSTATERSFLATLEVLVHVLELPESVYGPLVETL